LAPMDSRVFYSLRMQFNSASRMIAFHEHELTSFGRAFLKQHPQDIDKLNGLEKVLELKAKIQEAEKKRDEITALASQVGAITDKFEPFSQEVIGRPVSTVKTIRHIVPA
jgi:hypothetical protein